MRKIQKIFVIFIVLTIFQSNRMQAQETQKDGNTRALDQQYIEKFKNQGFTFSGTNTWDRLSESVGKYPERWKAAFDYILQTDLRAVAVGTYELLGRDCFVSISEYTTKSAEEAKIESHVIYTDIQMMITGKEYMGLTTREDAVIVDPYESGREACFYESSNVKLHLADEKKIFFFFPGEIHQPSLAVEQPEPIRKIVVKVKN